VILYKIFMYKHKIVDCRPEKGEEFPGGRRPGMKGESGFQVF
jgi:hypothetical protein